MQQKICDHLLKITEPTQDENYLKNALRTKDFVIGKEIYPSTSVRYFKIFFKEIRTDQELVPITPTMCFRSCYLQVDSDGTISLTDDKLKPYRSSKVFYFDQNKGILKSKTNWDIANEERLSSRCVKGLLSVGLFAVAATIAYGVANENIQFKMN